MTKLTIELPFPAAELNPNRRHDRRSSTLTGARQSIRTSWWALTVQAIGRNWVPPVGDIPVQVSFEYPSRKWDRDNSLAAVKAGLDGVAKALKVNDESFEPLTISRRGVDPRGIGRVLLTLEV